MRAPDVKNPAIEGLRAIAVLAVVVHHSWNAVFTNYFAPFQPGPAGVRLFFVLSGYLITGILLNARDRADREGAPRSGVLLAFYVRRAFRILPLAYLALVLAAVIGLSVMHTAPWWYVFYASNVRVALLQRFDDGVAHFWSLGVEEQFYFLWPTLILWTPRARMRTTMGLLIAAAVIARGLLAQKSPIAAYVLLVTRLDALAIGGWLAWRRHAAQAPASWPLLGAGILAIVLGSLWPTGAPVLTELGAVLLCGAIIDAAGRDALAPILRQVLTWRPLVALGGISYGMYVWHPLVPRIVDSAGRVFHVWLRFPGFGLARFVYMLAVTLLLAVASWQLVERPLNDLKRWFPYVRHRDYARAASTPIAAPSVV